MLCGSAAWVFSYINKISYVNKNVCYLFQMKFYFVISVSLILTQHIISLQTCFTENPLSAKKVVQQDSEDARLKKVMTEVSNEAYNSSSADPSLRLRPGLFITLLGGSEKSLCVFFRLGLEGD